MIDTKTTRMLHTAHTESKTHSGSLVSAKTVGICLGLIALAIGVVTLFNIPFATLVYVGVLLACPLMHIWMMKDGKHKH